MSEVELGFGRRSSSAGGRRRMALSSSCIPTKGRTDRNTVFTYDPDGHQIELLPHSAMHLTGEHQRGWAAS